MTIILCALSLLSAFLQSETIFDVEQSPRALYERAAEQWRAQRFTQAQVALEQLLKVHADSAIAELAVAPLCELYLRNQAPQRALQLLTTWNSRLAESKTIAVLAPQTLLKCKQLKLRGTLAHEDSEKRIAALQELATELETFPVDDAVLELKARTALALAHEYEQQVQFIAAEEQLRSACQWLQTEIPGLGAGAAPDADPFNGAVAKVDRIDIDAVRRDLSFLLPLADARHQLQIGNAAGCAARLKQMDLDRFGEADQVPVRFLWMEALLEISPSEAHAHIEWLNDFVAGQAEPPSWAPTLVLRQAEQLTRNKQPAAARTLLTQARSDFPEFPRLYEFDFLLARCAVAQIDFAAAEEHLHAALQCGSEDREAMVKARWLLGELNFLQHRHQAAIQWYEQVLLEKELPQWRTRAFLQMAKCQELTGQSELAIANYGRVALQSDALLARQARDRLTMLQAPTASPAHSTHIHDLKR